MIKNRIKVILAEKGIKNIELANAIGMKPSSLSNIMSGFQNCPLESAFDIADYFNLNIEDVFYKVNEADDKADMNKDFLKMLDKMKSVYSLYQNRTINNTQLQKLLKDFRSDFENKYTDVNVRDVLETIDADIYMKLPGDILLYLQDL